MFSALNFGHCVTPCHLNHLPILCPLWVPFLRIQWKRTQFESFFTFLPNHKQREITTVFQKYKTLKNHNEKGNLILRNLIKSYTHRLFFRWYWYFSLSHFILYARKNAIQYSFFEKEVCIFVNSFIFFFLQVKIYSSLPFYFI